MSGTKKYLKLYVGSEHAVTFSGKRYREAVETLGNYGPFAILPNIFRTEEKLRNNKIVAVEVRRHQCAANKTVTRVSIYELWRAPRQDYQVLCELTFYPNWVFDIINATYIPYTKHTIQAAYDILPTVLSHVSVSHPTSTNDYLGIIFMPGTYKLEHMYNSSGVLMVTAKTTYDVSAAGPKLDQRQSTFEYFILLENYYRREIQEQIIEMGGTSADAFVYRSKVQSPDTAGDQQLQA